MLDLAILVPFQGEEDLWLEPVLRQQQGPAQLVTYLARQRLERATGCDLKFARPDWVRPHRFRPRTAGAVALASSAERAGLRWHAIDAGELPLAEWRRRLLELAPRAPKLVAVNTTFVTEARWLHLFCALVRSALPASRLALGGYYYATDARAFLGAPADVFCVGEGEARLGQIGRRVRDGAHLDDIPGLFLRDSNGRLRSTGSPPVLDLESMPLPDWALSARMDPPLDPSKEPLLYNVETQRGCYFKCEFCTYRTLAEHTMMSPARAAQAVLNGARAGLGRTALVDATGTFPRERWQAVLEAIEDAGGSPHPLGTFARVSDLDDEVCARMARVGVRHLFIGQESGDQAILNSMRKGTKVSQVRPALDAMARHGIKGVFGFISGFSGEGPAQAANTLDMMLGLNEGYAEPVVLVASVDVFAVQDLAAVSTRAELGSREHPFGYRDTSMTAAQAAWQRLDYYVALAERSHAPATGFGLTPLMTDIANVFLRGGDWRTGFRWLKAYDRGMALFVRNERDGTPVDSRTLDDVRRILGSGEQLPAATVGSALGVHARSMVTRALLWEWQREQQTGAGLLTRLLAARTVWHSLGEPAAALEAFRRAVPPEAAAHIADEALAAREVAAASLIDSRLRKGKQASRQPVLPTGA